MRSTRAGAAPSANAEFEAYVSNLASQSAAAPPHPMQRAAASGSGHDRGRPALQCDRHERERLHQQIGVRDVRIEPGEPVRSGTSAMSAPPPPPPPDSSSLTSSLDTLLQGLESSSDSSTGEHGGHAATSSSSTSSTIFNSGSDELGDRLHGHHDGGHRQVHAIRRTERVPQARPAP